MKDYRMSIGGARVQVWSGVDEVAFTGGTVTGRAAMRGAAWRRRRAIRSSSAQPV